MLSIFFAFTVILGAVGSMVYGQVRLTELTEGINIAAQQLSESQSAYTQLKMRSDSRLSAGEIEAYAKDSLGMQKVEQGQIEYVTLSGGDKGEVMQESGAQNWFQSLWATLCQLLS